MEIKKTWRQYSIETLENINWGDPADAPTGLVKRCIELTKIPVENFTAADLRLMIGQKIALQYLVPLALEKLKSNIFMDAYLYEGDLLESVLQIDSAFWNDHEDYWQQLSLLLKDKESEIAEFGFSLENFNNVKF